VLEFFAYLFCSRFCIYTTFHQLPDKIGFSFKITCLVEWIEEINTVYILNDALAKDTQLHSKITYWLEKQYEYMRRGFKEKTFILKYYDIGFLEYIDTNYPMAAIDPNDSNKLKNERRRG